MTEYKVNQKKTKKIKTMAPRILIASFSLFLSALPDKLDFDVLFFFEHDGDLLDAHRTELPEALIKYWTQKWKFDKLRGRDIKKKRLINIKSD